MTMNRIYESLAEAREAHSLDGGYLLFAGHAGDGYQDDHYYVFSYEEALDAGFDDEYLESLAPTYDQIRSERGGRK